MKRLGTVYLERSIMVSPGLPPQGLPSQGLPSQRSLQRLIVDPEQIDTRHPVCPHLQLRSEQVHYLRHVLRLRGGDRFWVLDGVGGMWLGMLGEGAIAELSLGAAEAGGGGESVLPEVTLLLALPKQGFDDVLRQVTELGVSRIVPVLSERTVLKPGTSKGDRWQRILQEASEQCERLRVPQLLPPMPLTEALAQIQAEHRYIGVTRQAAPALVSVLPPGLPSAEARRDRLAIAFGPEGGWAEAEVARAIAAGYEPISLGPLILRTVTAPLAALGLILGLYSGSRES